MADASPIVGIDLGTTNSLVAVHDLRGPRVLADADGGVLLPSVVRWLSGGGVIVGAAAKAGRRDHPLDTVSSAKRLMGRAYAESARDAAQVGAPLVAGPRGMACVAPPAARRAVTPQEVGAEILRALRQQAEEALGVPVGRAVVTVPAYFDDAQRQATRDAGRLAGIEVVRIVNEPTAAALAYGIGRRLDAAQVVAVYDLGGGTFDVSILRVMPAEAAPDATAGAGEAPSAGGAEFFEVLATAGDTRLGGDDIDRLLVEELLRRMEGETSGSSAISSGAEAQAARWAVLLATAEQAKVALSEREEVIVAIDGADGGRFETVVRRSELEALIEPLVDRTIDCCRRALADARLAPAEIDRVVLVGGSSRIPAVRRAVEACFGTPPYTALDPDQVVALGAAVQAAILAGAAGDLLLLDVVPLSLGLETVGGGVAKLIMRNASVPARAREMFSTSVDGQTSVKLHVLQGERELVRDCRSLGEFHLRGVPPMPAGIPQVEVEFLVDANGILSVSAVERRSGKRAAIQVAPAYGLTREEVERMEQESVAHARSDMRAHRAIDLTVNAQLDLKWIGAALARVRDALDPEYLADLERRIAALGELVETARRAPETVDLDGFQQAKQALDEASARLHEVAIARSLREDAANRPG